MAIFTADHERWAAVDHWDLATVGTSLMVCDETKLIASPDPEPCA